MVWNTIERENLVVSSDPLTFARYDERSDVWSLGCIILELATCGFLDVSGLKVQV